ncbi:MAG: hypothetical protein M1144_06255 [Candidatus Thermoplasmatota archaeon]|nr:hypothetical protein [Candidatus Thermoplasmatota archaeon]
MQAPTNPPPMSPTKARKPVTVAIILILIVGLVAVAVAYLAFERVECSLGTAVSSDVMITPVALFNTPYGGNATTNLGSPTFTFGSGGLVFATAISSAGLPSGVYGTGKAPYLPEGLFTAYNWTLYSVKNSTVFTTSQAQPCTTGFVAAPAIQNGQSTKWYSTNDIAIPNATTDLGEAHFPPLGTGPSPFNLTYHPDVWFNNGFQTANYPAVNSCGLSGTQEITIKGTVSFPISVSLPGPNGHNVTVRGSLTYSSRDANQPTLQYEFPGNTGSWQIYSLAGTNTSGPLAFQYTPC